MPEPTDTKVPSGGHGLPNGALPPKALKQLHGGGSSKRKKPKHRQGSAEGEAPAEGGDGGDGAQEQAQELTPIDIQTIEVILAPLFL